MSKKQQQQQSSSAAAVFSAPKIDAPIAIVAADGAESVTLVGQAAQHLDRATAERLIRADPARAAVVVPWCAERFADSTMRPVNNPAGFLRRALTDPGECGFVRDAAGWTPPSPTRDAVAREARERFAAAVHQRESERRAAAAHQRDTDAAERRAADEAWASAPAELRENVRRDVGARLPRIVARDGATFAEACAADLLRRLRDAAHAAG